MTDNPPSKPDASDPDDDAHPSERAWPWPGRPRRPVRRCVDIAAPPTTVWRALTDDALLSRWTGSLASLDPRPGGWARFRGPAGERDARVTRAEPPHRLTWRWRFAEDEAEDLSAEVDLVLVETSAGTRLTVTETPAPAGPSAAIGSLSAGPSAAIGSLSAAAPAPLFGDVTAGLEEHFVAVGPQPGRLEPGRLGLALLVTGPAWAVRPRRPVAAGRAVRQRLGCERRAVSARSRARDTGTAAGHEVLAAAGGSIRR
ncbi:SRPBCC family protein [Egibacter rhizosphaerae]|uniref:SRPBCC family protein n=1 Tax=Egibacter rhizosphaerae TaxID=1670831 RepID=UPI0013F15871|nr:SRPBCC family protein [Egibacter rhizosphaerae]